MFTACVQGTVVEFLTKGHVGYFIEGRMVSVNNVHRFNFNEHNYVRVTA